MPEIKTVNDISDYILVYKSKIRTEADAGDHLAICIVNVVNQWILIESLDISEGAAMVLKMHHTEIMRPLLEVYEQRRLSTTIE